MDGQLPTGAESPGPTTAPPALAWWHHLVAAFVLFHLFTMFYLSLPMPKGGEEASMYRRPDVQAEVRAWRDGLARVGLELTEEEVVQWARGSSRAVLDVYRTVERPLRKNYANLVGCRQSWRMFSGTARRHRILLAEVRRGGEWTALWRSRSADLTWRTDVLDHETLRSLLNKTASSKRRFRPFVNLLARWAQQDFPDADQFRLTVTLYDALSPAEVRRGVEPEVHEQRSYTRLLPLESK